MRRTQRTPGERCRDADECGEAATRARPGGAVVAAMRVPASRQRPRALPVPPPRGLDEQAHPLLGDRLVQEAMHRAVGDLRGEHSLLVDAAGDDEHQLRELGV